MARRMTVLMPFHTPLSAGVALEHFADEGVLIVVHFAEVCSRSGFFLSSREPRPVFTWQDLVGWARQ